MNGRDFLPAARRMAAGTQEADWRSAASRAYYAAFHGARELLAVLRFRTPRADRAHNYLYVRLNNCGSPTVEQAANDLHDLRGLRNVADYDVGRSFAPDEAAGAIDSAANELGARLLLHGHGFAGNHRLVHSASAFFDHAIDRYFLAGPNA